jgi:DNA-binding FrmR family transcriptional regulator
MLSDDDKKKLAHRLARVIGQVGAINRMIEDDAYCVDILMQLSAANGALGKVGQIILENHLRTCVSEAINNGNVEDSKKKLEELISLFRKYASALD